MNISPLIAVFDSQGCVVALLTVAEYLDLPMDAITDICGHLSLI